MTRFMIALAMALLVSVISVMQANQVARASSGSPTAQTVPVYRQSCSATGASTVVGTARFSPDDQGGVPGGLEIRTGLTGGLPRTSYTVYLLAGPCAVIAGVGALTTDDSGRGDLDVHVAAGLVPAGSPVRVQLVAPADVLTSDSVWTS